MYKGQSLSLTAVATLLSRKQALSVQVALRLLRGMGVCKRHFVRGWRHGSVGGCDIGLRWEGLWELRQLGVREIHVPSGREGSLSITCYMAQAKS